jgi:hypothetical protein
LQRKGNRNELNQEQNLQRKGNRNELNQKQNRNEKGTATKKIMAHGMGTLTEIKIGKTIRGKTIPQNMQKTEK